MYDGTAFANIYLGPTLFVVYDRATWQAETYTNYVCAACASGNVPDHVGGSDADNYAEVTIPTTAGGAWDVHVELQVNNVTIGADGTDYYCLIQEDINDAGAFATVAGGRTSREVDALSAVSAVCHVRYIRRSATAGSAYAYRLIFSDIDGANVEDFNLTASSVTDTSDIVVEARLRGN